MGEIVPLLLFSKDSFGLKQTTKIDMPSNKEIEIMVRKRI